MSDPPERIPFHRPYIAQRELEYLAQAIRRGKLSGDGEFTRRCHSWIETRFSARRALLTTSCTSALEMAALLAKRAGETPGEVIVPGFTFVSTANAFVLHGFTPVFAEIREDTCNLDETRLEALLTKRTRAIVPVHYAGVPCEMNAIRAIAKRHDLLVIEDAAQAVSSTYRGQSAGTLGDLGAFSFHDTKNHTAGEGGALLVNRADFDHRAEVIREKGTNRSQFLRGEIDRYTWVDVGASYLPSELNAAFLLAQLENLDDVQVKRQALYERYREGLEALRAQGHVRLPVIPRGIESNHHIFFIMLASLEERAEMVTHLKTRGIAALSHYVALHTSPFGSQWAREPLPIVEAVANCILRLPLFADMTDAQVDRVVEGVEAFYKT